MTTAQERTDLLDKLGLDAQNKAALGRVLGTGSIGQATERADGRMEATIRIKPDEICLGSLDSGHAARRRHRARAHQ